MIGCMLPGDDSHLDPKGWDRASIAYKSRGPYRPKVSAADLRLPNEASKLRVLAISLASAAMMTVLYVAPPLFILNFWVPIGAWSGLALVGMLVALTAALFVFSAFETRSLRKLAKEL